MLRLLAISPDDGWAFVDRDGLVVAVRPPYLREAMDVTSAEAAEIAVQRYGFEACDALFQDWGDLLEYLRSRLSESLSNKAAIPFADFAPEILNNAPKRLLTGVVREIGENLIPNRKWQAALRLLKSLQRSENVMRDAEMRESVLHLLSDCADRMMSRTLEQVRLIQEEGKPYAERFPDLVRAKDPGSVKELAEKVAERHQVFFAIGA